jgi:hypothetical protein
MGRGVWVQVVTDAGRVVGIVWGDTPPVATGPHCSGWLEDDVITITTGALTGQQFSVALPVRERKEKRK